VGCDRDVAEDGHFASLAERMTRYFHTRQRPDGLWQGFLYAMDGELRFKKMDPYYMTGYALPPLIWAEKLPPAHRPAPLPDLSVLTRTERTISYRAEGFHVCASGKERQKARSPGGPTALEGGPEDVFVLDAEGPSIWGFACQVLGEDGKRYGDVGGFTPHLHLDPDAWRAERTADGWLVCQRLLVRGCDPEVPVAELHCELEIRRRHATLRVRGKGPGVRQWRVGPNARASLGELAVESGHTITPCARLSDEVPVNDEVRLLANDRALTVSLDVEGPHRWWITPIFDNNRSLRHRLAPGDVTGLRLEMNGDPFEATWRFDAG